MQWKTSTVLFGIHTTAVRWSKRRVIKLHRWQQPFSKNGPTPASILLIFSCWTFSNPRLIVNKELVHLSLKSSVPWKQGFKPSRCRTTGKESVSRWVKVRERSQRIRKYLSILGSSARLRRFLTFDIRDDFELKQIWPMTISKMFLQLFLLGDQMKNQVLTNKVPIRKFNKARDVHDFFCQLLEFCLADATLPSSTVREYLIPSHPLNSSSSL